MNNKVALASLAMDLRRVSMGLYRGSNKMAERFFIEAMRRKNEINVQGVKPYLQKLLNKLDSIKLSEQESENMLTYSIIIQNAATMIVQ